MNTLHRSLCAGLALCLLVLAASAATGTKKNSQVGRGINGGFSCATCTVLFSVASQLTQIYNESLADSLERMCGYLPTSYVSQCKSVVYFLAPFILDELIIHSSSPDALCYALKLCYVEPGRQMCHLFPLPPNWLLIRQQRLRRLPKPALRLLKGVVPKLFPWLCYLPGIKQICEALDDVYDKLVPGIDLDGDWYSPAETLRGALWRGRDCSDLDANFYPGRRPLDGDRLRDSNCNGIWGINPDTGAAYEEELCQGSGQRGIIYLGDSIGAHFHVPEAWFTPTSLGSGILTNVSYVVSNEADWPDIGFATGFRNATYMPDLVFDDQVDSIYLRLRKRNLCNHRDYQNLARNGAESNDTLTYMRSMSRHLHADHPALVFFGLMGNDVCNEKTDTERFMTTPQQFYERIMAALKYLETVLPAESHVVFIGLIDGSVLYKAMASRTHPLGRLRHDLTYDDVYNWFNCMEIGPCHGWMTSNATLRDVTTQRAQLLTSVLKQIVRSEKFASFDLHFLPNPFQRVIDKWLDQGGQLWQLIEPVDSLHPTQQAQAMFANEIWSYMEREMPFVLGPTNSRNDQIRRLFGDQGGH